jgi:uncharacterized protein
MILRTGHRRAMDIQETIAFLKNAESGRIATVSENGMPHVVPVNHVYDDGHIYFHCALKGRKLDDIAGNPKVCFEADSLDGFTFDVKTSCKCSTYYHSVIAYGTARIVTDPVEKVSILGLIMEKYTHGEYKLGFPEKEVEHTAVVAIEIEEISGKKHEKK